MWSVDIVRHDNLHSFISSQQYLIVDYLYVIEMWSAASKKTSNCPNYCYSKFLTNFSFVADGDWNNPQGFTISAVQFCSCVNFPKRKVMKFVKTNLTNILKSGYGLCKRSGFNETTSRISWLILNLRVLRYLSLSGTSFRCVLLCIAMYVRTCS